MTASEHSMIGRVGALAILLILAVAVWVGPVEAYLGALADGAARIDAETALLQRYRALAAAGLPAQSAVPGPDLLIPDMPEMQAAAMLQETIKGAATAAQVEIRGMQVLQEPGASRSAGTGIRVNASGDIAGLGRLLYAIEAARPVLYPDNLQVRASPASGQTAPRLEFQLDVSGIRAGGT
jgi:hypothetical protein